MNQPLDPKRILIATIGSLGDLHPCLALALELARRGHHITIASTPFYRATVEALGISFRPLRPDWDPTSPELIRLCNDLKKGAEVLYRQIILPHLQHTYSDLLEAARHADLLVTGEIVYAAPLVAEKLNLPWVSIILSPYSFFSSIDPSIIPNAPVLFHLRRAGPRVYRAGLAIGKLATRHWSNPVRQLRRQLGLNPDCDPVFRDKFSPWLVLALFSQQLARPQADWPRQTIQPGFIFYSPPHIPNPSAELSSFLASGPPPIVFGQGSTAVHSPGDFYQVSAAAAQRLGRRAILVGNKAPASPHAANLLNLPYAPYSDLFPRAIVNVHQGGSGTTGEALRSGKPMLIVPYGWDQPDNAERIQRLGTGLHLPRKRYTVNQATAALSKLIEDPSYSLRATAVAKSMAAEDGLRSACDSIESLLRQLNPPPQARP